MEKLRIARPVEPEQYEWIKNVVLSFGYGPEEYMVIDIKGKQNDLLFIQTKRSGALFRLEAGYDKEVSFYESPLIVGSMLSEKDLLEWLSRFCLSDEPLPYELLLSNGFSVVRSERYDEAPQWAVIRNESGNIVYEGFTIYNKPHGAGTVYHPDGKIYQEGIFGMKGLLLGREYYPNGELRFEGVYRINKGYGPNFPVYGKSYDEYGVLQYDGKFKIHRSGLGYPFVEEPENFGKVSLDYRPHFDRVMWHDPENIKDEEG